VSDKNRLGAELLLAIAFGRAAEATRLISLGADIDARDDDAGTPLYYAAEWPDNRMLEVVKLIIQRGADINARWKDGFTPLHNACMSGSADCVEILLLHGADVHAREHSYGDTPLHVVCRCGSRAVWGTGPSEEMRIALMLLGRGADWIARDKDGKTAFDLAKDAKPPDEALLEFMTAIEKDFKK